MVERFERISDEQARALWQRAAQLQASAERQNQAAFPVSTSGLSLDQVAGAAEGAGIDPDFVRIALAEKQLPDAAALDPDLWTARWLRRLVNEPDAIDLKRSVNAPPERVLAALRAITSRPSYDLVLEATIGADPLSDGVLVYRLANDESSFQEGMNWADARVLLFTIRPEGEGASVHVRVPLYRRGVNLALSGGMSTGLAAGGMSLGAAVSGAIPAVAAGLVMLPVAIGGIAGATLGLALYRGIYRWIYRGGVAAVAQLLQAIVSEAEAKRPDVLESAEQLS